MSFSEFSLIKQYFDRGHVKRKDVKLGIGDDCALLEIPQGQQLAVTVDTMVENVHFLATVSAKDLAWKSIAVNLSDLAAIGAEPTWLTLALTLPETRSEWLNEFSSSFFEYADHYGLQLIGGDTCRGPLSITIQAMGFVPIDSGLKRSGANPGDLIFVTGSLGDAGLGLEIASGQCDIECCDDQRFLLERFNRPTPRVAVGIALRRLATSAIDLSDGLAGDLQHILTASGVGAEIDLDKLPLSTALLAQCDFDSAMGFAVASGDDYELCFTVAEDNLEQLGQVMKGTGCDYGIIGRITGSGGLTYTHNNQIYDKTFSGYRHFQADATNDDETNG